MSEYTRFLDLVRSQSDFPILLLYQKHGERIEEILLDLLLASVEDDLQTLKYLKYLHSAMRDRYVAELIEGVDKGKPFLSIHKSEVQDALYKFDFDWAERAVKLWSELPVSGIGTGRDWVAQDETRPVPIKIPILLETRKQLLSYITDRWRRTTSELEAVGLLEALYRLPLHFPEERKLFDEAIRNTVNVGFPLPRLVNSIRLLKPGQSGVCSGNDCSPILAQAWGKHVKSELRGHAFGLIQQVMDCSPGAFDFLTAVAGQLSVLDQALLELKDKLTKINEYWNTNRQFDFSYESFTAATVKGHFSLPTNSWHRPWTEEKGHEWFEAAKRVVQDWQREHRCNVLLVFDVKITDLAKEPCYTRSAVLEPPII